MTIPRRHPRGPVECPVTFYLEDGTPGTGRLYDLSQAGCGIVSELHAMQGSYVVLSIGLPDPSSVISVELARVRWAMRQEFGVEFILIPRADKAKLDQFLAQRQPDNRLTH